MGHTTISVEDKTLERFKSLKQELDDQQDAPDHTANSFLQALLDTWEAAEDGYYDEGVPEDVRDQLDRIEAGVEAIEDRTGTIEDHLGARYG